MRKLVGAIALVLLVACWVFLAMGFAQFVLASENRAIEFAYYVVAGIGWVLPAMPLVSWMSRSPKR
jgi:TM2 domain-containing membrane protein YozV